MRYVNGRNSLYYCALLCLLAAPSAAQDEERPEPAAVGFSGIPFSFAPPGARALGMGGAFIAIADDATASEANPAGLTILTRSEVSIHGRHSSFDLEAQDLNAVNALGIVNSFRRSLRDDGFDVPDVSAPTTGTFDDPIDNVSFVSFVKPLNKWVFSIYYQQTSNFKGSTSFGSPNFFLDDIFFDAYSTGQVVEVVADGVGISGAFKVGKLSLGASLRYSQLDVKLDRFLRIDYFNDFEFDTGNFDHTDFFLFQDTIDDDDNDVTFNVGLLYNQNGKVSVGLVYKEGGKYTISDRANYFLCVDLPGFFTCDPGARTGNGFLPLSDGVVDREFELPDFLGLGLAFRPTQRLTFAIDVNRITYSNLDSGLFDLFRDPANDTLPELVNAVEKVDDGTEFHFGLEYVFTAGQTAITVRGGAFTEEDHDGFANVDSSQTSVTAGLGFVIKQNFQVDLAGRFSDAVDEGLISIVYRF